MDLPHRIYRDPEVERLFHDLLNVEVSVDINGGVPAHHASTHLPGGSDALTTGIPGSIQPDDSAAEGVAAAFARSDHRHAIVAAAPGSIVPGDVAAEGVATSFARSDHTHGQALEDQYLGFVAAFSIQGWPK